METPWSLASQRRASKSSLSHWVLFHRKLIIPLLGDNSIREQLNNADDVQQIHPYERQRFEPQGFAHSTNLQQELY